MKWDYDMKKWVEVQKKKIIENLNKVIFNKFVKIGMIKTLI